MKIRYGNKRIVVLIDNHAIKIGKIRFIRTLSRIIVLPFSERLRVRFLNKYGGTWRLAILNDMFAGLLCNRHEYSYSTSHSDDRIMPTRKLLLSGHVVIQQRAKKASHADVIRRFPQYRSTQYKDANLDHTAQYGIDSCGNVGIIDYGDKVTTDLLRQTML